MNLSFSRKQYNWMFITTNLTITLLGADFLKAQIMMVGIVEQQLITQPIPITPLPPTPAQEKSPLLQEFPKVFKDGLQQDLTKPAKHHIQHCIVTEDHPVHARFRRLTPEKLFHAKQAFEFMEQAGMCQKSSSPWVSTLLMAPKPDGTWQPCGNYQRLNIMTT
ncbi:uncharacterized protein LOC135222443 [Macrobrachium nipponense]|uniref:uncharacterized protein LOC135222443 n=1 Tax=Macrobrachium nipponense TaxID=159736 RepID=UPI0030C8CFD7